MKDFNAAIEKREINGIIKYAASLLKISPEDFAQLLWCLRYILLDPERNYSVFEDNKTELFWNKKTALFWEELFKYLPNIKEEK